MKHTCGKFTFDEESNTLEGPKQYMDEQGDALCQRILAGEDVIFNTTSHLSPNAAMSVLVRLQTDYAAWLGNRQMLKS